MARTWMLGCIAIALGCGADDPAAPGFAGTQQYMLSAADGHVEFYLGSVVRDEVARTGRFVPGGEKSYSMIRVPRDMVPERAGAADPFTVSLCDTANDVTLFHRIVSEKAKEYAPVPGQCPDPHMTVTDTTVGWTYRSGDPGVYGFAQVRWTEDGNLVAGAAAPLRIPFPCDEHPGYAEGGWLLGIPSAHDPMPEDPILEQVGGQYRGCDPPRE